MRGTIGILICASVFTSCISTEEPNKVVSVPPRAPTSAPASQGEEHHPTWPVLTNQRAGVDHPGSAELVAHLGPPARWDARGHPRSGLDAIRHAPRCEPIPRGQALLALSEFRPSEDEPPGGLERDFPPRPYRLEATLLRSSQVRKGCIQPRAQLFRFPEADRFLYAWVMFGRDLFDRAQDKDRGGSSTLEVQPSK